MSAPASAVEDASDTATLVWADAGIIAALLAIDPTGLGGVRLRASPSPARTVFLDRVKALLPPGAAWVKAPAQIDTDRLVGGLDLAATLAAGKPVNAKGVLAQADGGVLALAMAERIEPGAAALIAAAMDAQAVRPARGATAEAAPARFAVLALDEGVEDEAPPAALLDRLAFDLDLRMMRWSALDPWPVDPEAVVAARRRFPDVTVPHAVAEALSQTGAGLQIGSVRGEWLALRVARAHAALDGRETADAEDAELAARLVLAPRARAWPAPPEEPEEPAPPEPPPPEDGQDQDPPPDPPPLDDQDLADLVLAAAEAALPADVLAQLAGAQPSRGRSGGRGGARMKAKTRGRPIGARPGRPGAGARLNVLETLRAAAPMQRLRSKSPSGRLAVRAEDFRIARFKARTQTVTIFLVDASGSAALARLAEAKGAVEMMLAECYVRRDEVALIAFRGTTAELVLPPTRSLARAKRTLAGLPGGGATPIATALQAGAELADAVIRQGMTPVLVLMTDGRANVAADGGPGRERAQADAEAAAQQVRQAGLAGLLIDTASRPNRQARALAEAMGADYLALPYSDPAAISNAAKAAARGA